MVDDRLRHQRTDKGSETVSHHHKQTLRTAADAVVCLLIHEQRTRYIEEVEGNAIDYHREEEQPNATARIAETEEAESQHPTQECNQYDLLDAET